jgi:hypothetical protein
VIELPNSALGSGTVGLWARTLDGANGKWVQADRGARPQQTPFLPGDERNAYLAGQPADDARFIAAFAHSLEHAGGYTPGKSKAGGSDTTAGHTALWSQAPDRLPQQRPRTH